MSSVGTRYDTNAARRAQAREAGQDFQEALYADRPDLEASGGKIKAPPDLKRESVRFGGRYRGGGEHGTSGNYDWFYELNKEEQARIRANWFGGDLSPDEVEDMDLPMHEWLALTRGIDAAKAVQTGRDLQVKRYGGRNPLAYLDRARGDEDEGDYEPHRGRGNGKVQFFTDKKGIVHPIRASYEGKSEAPPENKGGKAAAGHIDEDF